MFIKIISEFWKMNPHIFSLALWLFVCRVFFFSNDLFSLRADIHSDTDIEKLEQDITSDTKAINYSHDTSGQPLKINPKQMADLCTAFANGKATNQLSFIDVSLTTETVLAMEPLFSGKSKIETLQLRNCEFLPYFLIFFVFRLLVFLIYLYSTSLYLFYDLVLEPSDIWICLQIN